MTSSVNFEAVLKELRNYGDRDRVDRFSRFFRHAREINGEIVGLDGTVQGENKPVCDCSLCCQYAVTYLARRKGDDAAYTTEALRLSRLLERRHREREAASPHLHQTPAHMHVLYGLDEDGELEVESDGFGSDDIDRR